MTGAAPHESEIPFEQAPGLAELAERADRHERLRLVRAGEAPALVMMTEDDFDRAVTDAADLAVCLDALDRIAADPRPPLVSGTPEFETFLQEFTRRP
jgi:hypothetical protein